VTFVPILIVRGDAGDVIGIAIVDTGDPADPKAGEPAAIELASGPLEYFADMVALAPTDGVYGIGDGQVLAVACGEGPNRWSSGIVWRDGGVPQHRLLQPDT